MDLNHPEPEQTYAAVWLFVVQAQHKLTAYVDNGNMPSSSNRAENVIRPLCSGAKERA